MKKIGFWSLLMVWFFAAIALFLLNGFTLKSSLAHSCILASLGTALLFYPAYPPVLEETHSPAWCRRFVRVLAAVEIMCSFAVRTSF